MSLHNTYIARLCCDGCSKHADVEGCDAVQARVKAADNGWIFLQIGHPFGGGGRSRSVDICPECDVREVVQRETRRWIEDMDRRGCGLYCKGCPRCRGRCCH